MNLTPELIADLRDFLTAQQLTRESTRLNDAFSRLETKEFSILICGEFSRGKSSLINAMLGQEVLATSLLRLPTVNTVKGAGVRTGKVTRLGEVQEVPFAEIVSIRDANSVELTWDNALFKQNVRLVEYPSMSEAPDPEDFEKAVAQADLVVVVVAADSLYSHAEATIVDKVIKANGHQRTLFIINFWDRIAQKDQDDVRQAAWIRLPVNKECIFFLSTMDALDGNEHGLTNMAAFGEALQKAADDRLNIKNGRLIHLSKICVAALEQNLNNTAEQSSQNQKEGAESNKLIQKSLQELKNIRDDIQNNLSELRNSTRDILHAKLSNFIKELKSSIPDWYANYTGDKLDEHLNQQLKQAVNEFVTQDFGPYLRQRSEEQGDLLTNGMKRYQNGLEDLYKLLPMEFKSIQMVNHANLTQSQFDIKLVSDSSSKKKTKVGFDYNKMLEMPESLIILATTAIGSMLFRHLAIFIAPVGLLLSGLVSALRARGQTYKAEDLLPYEIQFTEQARHIETKVIKDLTDEMNRVYDDVNNVLVETTKIAEKDTRAYIQSTQASSNSGHSMLADFSKLREKLGF